MGIPHDIDRAYSVHDIKPLKCGFFLPVEKCFTMSNTMLVSLNQLESIMALTPEKKVKNAVVKILKKYKAYYFFPATFGMGRSGIPDVVACVGYHGHFVGIECKAGKNKPTALQHLELADIKAAGGTAVVINETNLDELETILEGLQQ